MRTKLDAISIAAVLVTVGAFSATAPLTAFATGSAVALALGRNAPPAAQDRSLPSGVNVMAPHEAVRPRGAVPPRRPSPRESGHGP